MAEKLLYTIQEAAEALAMSEATLYRKLRSGEIRAVRDGRRFTRIAREDLEAYIQRHRTQRDEGPTEAGPSS